jgi:hypothetical protein
VATQAAFSIIAARAVVNEDRRMQLPFWALVLLLHAVLRLGDGEAHAVEEAVHLLILAVVLGGPHVGPTRVFFEQHGDMLELSVISV